jgi:hypothetical protein
MTVHQSERNNSGALHQQLLLVPHPARHQQSRQQQQQPEPPAKPIREAAACCPKRKSSLPPKSQLQCSCPSATAVQQSGSSSYLCPILPVNSSHATNNSIPTHRPNPEQKQQTATPSATSACRPKRNISAAARAQHQWSSPAVP